MCKTMCVAPGYTKEMWNDLVDEEEIRWGAEQQKNLPTEMHSKSQIKPPEALKILCITC